MNKYIIDAAEHILEWFVLKIYVPVSGYIESAEQSRTAEQNKIDS